jgi:hypothetical protein
MNLSTAQQDMVNRAYGDNPMRTHDSRRIYSNDYYRDNLSTHAVCDVYGSGEHRTARALEKKGIGRMFTKAPCDCYFFKVYKNDAERIADEEKDRLFWEAINDCWKR